ncbi:MAG: hypothetical protein JRJ14_09405, partial [Deltaproteobacteria bacterium]|nr:hypothetical protein [Deltaproteobacteria bacterium]
MKNKLKVTEQNQNIEREVSEIKAGLGSDKLQELLRLKEKLIHLKNSLVAGILPSQRARNSWDLTLKEVGITLKEKLRLVERKSKENIRVGLLEIKTELDTAETIEELMTLRAHYDDLVQVYRSMPAGVDAGVYQDLISSVNDKLEARIRTTETRIEKDQKIIEAVIKRASKTREEEIEDVHARSRILGSTIQMLEAANDILGVLPSTKLHDQLENSFLVIYKKKKELYEKTRKIVRQLTIIDEIKGAIEKDNLIDSILEWELFGRDGLIEASIRPEDLAQRVYALLERLDRSVAVAKKFYDETDQRLKEVV